MTTDSTAAHGISEAITEKTVSMPASTAITASLPAIDSISHEPTPPPGPWVVRTDCALLCLVLVLAFFVASFAASNSDLWMHLAIGKRISDGKFEFGVDPFSWATTNSWWSCGSSASRRG